MYGNKTETYRNFSFLKFCKPVGKGPERLFAQTELREKSKLVTNHERERERERERENMEMSSGIEAHSIGIDPER